jgi:N-acetylmuramoyl-L-alanine amidase
LHFNATGAATENPVGLETYCLTPRGMPSTLTRGYDDDTSLFFPNNAFDAENWRLAFQLQRTLLEESGALDHGVRRARFMGVLRGQNRPAVLVEGGYLSNPREARQIADPAYRQTLAEAMARALIEKSETRVQKTETGTRRSDAEAPAPTWIPEAPVVSTNSNPNGR